MWDSVAYKTTLDVLTKTENNKYLKITIIINLKKNKLDNYEQ